MIGFRYTLSERIRDLVDALSEIINNLGEHLMFRLSCKADDLNYFLSRKRSKNR